MRDFSGATVAACLLVLGAAPSVGFAKPVVHVADVEALYQAVNDPANAGAEVHIAPGVYELSELTPSGSERPSSGRLLLLPDMDLVGDNEYLLVAGRPAPRDARGEIFADPRTETVLDGSKLVGGVSGPAGTLGTVLAGRANTIRGLTIRGSATSVAEVHVDLPGDEPVSLVVADCTLEGGRDGGRRGVHIAHVEEEDTVSTVVLARNIIRHHRGAFGFGVQAVRVLTDGDTFRVTLDHNVIYDNWVGVFWPNLNSSDARTLVTSTGNVHRDNGAGMVILGGRDFPFGFASQRNRVEVTSSDDAFVSNREGVGLGGGAGIFAVAGLNDLPVPAANADNVVVLNLSRTQFISATGMQNGVLKTLDHRTLPRNDLELYGALSASGQVAGTGNLVQVSLSGLSGSPIGNESVFAYAVGADVPEPTNQVVWVGGLEALAANNPLVPIVVRP